VVKIANSNVKNRFRKCYQNIWYDIKKCNSIFMPYGGNSEIIDEYTGNAKKCFFENSRTWVTWKD
jgi:hypothetical protein